MALSLQCRTMTVLGRKNVTDRTCGTRRSLSTWSTLASYTVKVSTNTPSPPTASVKSGPLRPIVAWGWREWATCKYNKKKGFYHARSDGYALVNPALGGPYFLIAAAVGMVEASRTAVCKIVLLSPLSTLRSIKPTDCTKIKNSISNPVCELIYMLLKICSLHQKWLSPWTKSSS